MPDLTAEELKDKEENELIDLINPNTKQGEQVKIILAGKMLDCFIKTLNKNTESSNKLSEKIYVLNIIIAIATVIYAITTILALFN